MSQSSNLVATQNEFDQSDNQEILLWVCKLTDSGIESDRECDLEDEPHDEGFGNNFQECSCSLALKQEDALVKVEQTTNNLESVLNATIKERDFYKLKCHQLEQQVAILEEAKKAREDEVPAKLSSTRNSNLQKIGLTEDILLSLPFGYATKVRSTFDKLSYENEKLCSENVNLACKSKRIEKSLCQLLEDHRTLQETAATRLNELSEQNKKLMSRLEIVSKEKRVVSESLEVAQGQIRSHLESMQNLYQVVAMMTAEIQQLQSCKQSSEKPENEMEKLKRKCSLLSQINTTALMNNSSTPMTQHR